MSKRRLYGRSVGRENCMIVRWFVRSVLRKLRVRFIVVFIVRRVLRMSRLFMMFLLRLVRLI